MEEALAAVLATDTKFEESHSDDGEGWSRIARRIKKGNNPSGHCCQFVMIPAEVCHMPKM